MNEWTNAVHFAEFHPDEFETHRLRIQLQEQKLTYGSFIHACTYTHTTLNAHTRFPYHTIPFRWSLFTILIVRVGSKIFIDKFTHMYSFSFVFFTALCIFPQWEEKQKPRWEFFWYFHCFLYETNKPYAIMGIRDGIWGGCQYLGECVYVCCFLLERPW